MFSQDFVLLGGSLALSHGVSVKCFRRTSSLGIATDQKREGLWEGSLHLYFGFVEPRRASLSAQSLGAIWPGEVLWGSLCSVHMTAQAAQLFLSVSAREGWGQARDKWRLGLRPSFPSRFLQPDAEVEPAGSEAGVDSPGRLKGGKEGVPVTWGGSSRAALLSS